MSPRKNSATPSRPPRKNGGRQTSVKREPPEIDLTAIRPPSPTEDPLLLSAGRPRPNIRPRFTSSSPLYPTPRHTPAQDTQWDVWTDTESEGEGEYTGRFKMFRVPTKADPMTSGTKARMKEWGRPVSPFPYEARLDRSLPDPEHMEIADTEDEGIAENILDALDAESVFEDIVELPPSSDDMPRNSPTSNLHIGAQESDDSDVDVESSVVRITGSDPKAAARAAAILKLHDYDCVLASSKRATRKRRTTLIDVGIAKRRTTMQGRHAIHTLGDRTPWCDVEDIMQDKSFVEQHTPVTTPCRVGLGHTEERIPRLSSSAQPEYKPKAGEWRREDWKLLDKCFFEECYISGGLVAPEKVDREAVVMQFKHLVGGHDVVKGLGTPWSCENLLARVDILVKKRAARADISTLSFASSISPPTDIRRKFVITPARKPPEQQKPHRDFVDLHHASPLRKRTKPRPYQPKRLVELRHISPEPLQRLFDADCRARRSSGGSVKDLIQCFEVTKDIEPASGGSGKISANTLQSRLIWKP